MTVAMVSERPKLNSPLHRWLLPKLHNVISFGMEAYVNTSSTPMNNNLAQPVCYRATRRVPLYCNSHLPCHLNGLSVHTAEC